MLKASSSSIRHHGTTSTPSRPFRAGYAHVTEKSSYCDAHAAANYKIVVDRHVTAELHGTMVSSHAALTAASQPAADPPVLFWGSRRPGGWGTHLLTWAGVLEGPVLPPRIFFSPDFWSKMAHFRGFWSAKLVFSPLIRALKTLPLTLITETAIRN